MIRIPYRGQPAQVWYAAEKRRGDLAACFPHHGRVGTVIITSHGRGPRNVGVLLGSQVVVVPRGNLRRPQGAPKACERQENLW